MASDKLMNGSDLVIKLGASTDPTAVVAYATSCSLEVTRDEIDQSNKQSGAWKSAIGGMRSWSVSSEALYFVGTPAGDYAGTTMADIFGGYMADAGTGGVDLYVEFSIKGTPASGDKFFSGVVKVTSLSISGGTEDQATYSATFTGSGALTLETAS